MSIKRNNINIGDKFLYFDSKTNKECKVTIKEIHYDDIPPFYTILFKDGNERQTVKSKLKKIRKKSLKRKKFIEAPVNSL